MSKENTELQKWWCMSQQNATIGFNGRMYHLILILHLILHLHLLIQDLRTVREAFQLTIHGSSTLTSIHRQVILKWNNPFFFKQPMEPQKSTINLSNSPFKMFFQNFFWGVDAWRCAWESGTNNILWSICCWQSPPQSCEVLFKAR